MRALAVLCVLVFGLSSACSSANSEPTGSLTVPTKAEVDESTGLILVPADAYWVTDLELAEITSAMRVAMISCKRRMNVPTDEPRRTIPDEQDTRRFAGLWRMANAERYGYVTPMSKAKEQAIADQSDPLSAPTQAELDAAETCASSDSTVMELQEQPPDGPWLRALNAAEDEARASRDWAEVVADWGSCLAERGLSVDTENMAPDGVDWKAVGERRVQPVDVELAVVDVTCKRQHDTAQRLADLVAAAQAPVVAKYGAELQDQRAGFDRQLAKARRVLSEAGL